MKRHIDFEYGQTYLMYAPPSERFRLHEQGHLEKVQLPLMAPDPVRWDKREGSMAQISWEWEWADLEMANSFDMVSNLYGWRKLCLPFRYQSLTNGNDVMISMPNKVLKTQIDAYRRGGAILLVWALEVGPWWPDKEHYARFDDDLVHHFPRLFTSLFDACWNRRSNAWAPFM